MRVLILSQYYFPEGVPKPHELAEALKANGHEVSVITGFPHYPGGKLKSGYKLGLIKRENINDVPIVRMFEIPYHSTNPLLRIANYFSFMVSAPFGAFFTPQCDVIYVWHPPLTIGIAAWLVAKIKGVPFVYDVQDIWGHFVVLSGMVREGSFSVKLIRKLEKFVCRRANSLIVQTEAGRSYFTDKGIESEKIAILPNWIDEKMFTESSEMERQALREKMGWKDKFIILFAGNLGIVQGLDSVVEAARHIPNGSAKIVFIGEGTDKPRLEKLAKELNVGERIQFVDRQPMEKMPGFMSAADALLVNLKKSDLSKFVIPSKTVAYLASGKPILMATGGASADLIKEAKAGISVEPENAVELAKAIEEMRKMPFPEREKLGLNGKEFLQKNLSKVEILARYEQLLSETAEKFKQKSSKNR
jgi:glycosyltransferase involved in cell wall biosynthesis